MPSPRALRLLLFAVLLPAAAGGVLHGQVASTAPMFQVGEDLEYRVSYLLFNLGTIRVQVLERFERDGRMLYRTRATIDSNPSLSWLIELHAVFESEVDEEMFSHQWISDEQRRDVGTYRRLYLFDYERQRVIIERGMLAGSDSIAIERVDTVALTAKCQDGLSLFYYAREHVRRRNQDNVPTMIEREQVNTFINFMNRVAPVEIDSATGELEAVEFDGRADFVGIAGLTGGFRGWFSNDDARVPLLARMNVILGSVKIELIRWNRPGWSPPRFRRS